MKIFKTPAEKNLANAYKLKRSFMKRTKIGGAFFFPKTIGSAMELHDTMIEYSRSIVKYDRADC